ncbi:MAG: DUF4338 domain-containing protein [Sterolibacteriaceae bacterium]|nr:DUF4338 domain-containing protein [Sterolibacteriaceae bacterium]
MAQCNAYVERFHPLGYHKPFGYWARYRIEAADRSLGYLLLCGAARAIEPRDRWIGWSARQRLANLPWVVNNNRFLVFPWVRIEHLASHVLASWHASWPMTGRRAGDTGRCCWRALSIRRTIAAPATARRLAVAGAHQRSRFGAPGKHYHSSAKLIFVKALQAQCRRLLCCDQLQERHEPWAK